MPPPPQPKWTLVWSGTPSPLVTYAFQQFILHFVWTQRAPSYLTLDACHQTVEFLQSSAHGMVFAKFNLFALWKWKIKLPKTNAQMQINFRTFTGTSVTHRLSLVNMGNWERGWQIQSGDWVFLGDAEIIVGLEMCFGMGNVYCVLVHIGDCTHHILVIAAPRNCQLNVLDVSKVLNSA